MFVPRTRGNLITIDWTARVINWKFSLAILPEVSIAKATSFATEHAEMVKTFFVGQNPQTMDMSETCARLLV